MKRSITLIALVLVLWLIGLNTVNAQRSDEPTSPHSDYDLSWYTIDDGGGGSSRGSGYSLDGTIGQPEAGAMHGGSYTLAGGFWGGGVIVPALNNYSLFLPLVLK